MLDEYGIWVFAFLALQKSWWQSFHGTKYAVFDNELEIDNKLHSQRKAGQAKLGSNIAV